MKPYNFFTFHSGYIYTFIFAQSFDPNDSLHSILVKSILSNLSGTMSIGSSLHSILVKSIPLNQIQSEQNNLSLHSILVKSIPLVPNWVVASV